MAILGGLFWVMGWMGWRGLRVLGDWGCLSSEYGDWSRWFCVRGDGKCRGPVEPRCAGEVD